MELKNKIKIILVVIFLSIETIGFTQPFLTGGYQGGNHGDGGIETFPTIIEETQLADKGNLKVYPNPFQDEIKIALSLSEPNKVRISIYDIINKEVKLLSPSTRMQSGDYTFHWDGKNNQNIKVGKGNYYLHIKVGDQTTIKKVIYM